MSKDDDGSVMEDQALRDELMTLLVAGQETSAILMGWVCATLAWNPEVQDHAANELQVHLFLLHGARPYAALFAIRFLRRPGGTGTASLNAF